ncbi:sigma-54-dependent Fis family transcriptional regulator [Thermosulfuriphilus ammonigenes]|uniref:Sigma-54-dependent Fis family transcriptional regulator n=1 Tax=Thermosulfuriphilus ammonigenes TaxID=1936021 RepID=A0A6G7PTF8_9BACT|nr:sigma-54 dependent transcriptional regulator [Thermosulfuriphilus ammonigenes]MBA2848921.1 two-component system NtrC family response regulator [Thermosulfuriphilus ammonigenes]QIJ70964.1 sigma-54-dependent Fis family transcriptional regulator [Thermosulfuriphilus ammonigenes]
MKARVLLIDDDESFREVMLFNLQEEGLEVDVARDGHEGLNLFFKKDYQLVITDLKMPGADGMEVLRSIKQRSPEVPVVVITAFGDIATAVQAMKEGAYDFLPKPCERDHFKLVVKKALEHFRLKREVQDLRQQLAGGPPELVFQSRAMEKVVALADKVAAYEATVLILGESGTGKELLARRIHHQSPRARGPFVAINCGAIPRDLLESELFGYRKGAFTGADRDKKGRFELANGGTIFLDEIAELPLELQVKLLRVLQERTIDVLGAEGPRPVDVRIIAATNRDLEKMVKEGAFREDLYFRLNVFPIRIPPLRQRPEDIPVLIRHFLKVYGPGRRWRISPAVMNRLKGLSWRGNVRELENICQRMVLLAEGEEITEELLDYLDLEAPMSNLASTGISLPPEGISLLDIEKEVIIKALEMNNYNQSQTARFLRIPRHVLLYRIEKYQIPLKRDEKGK